MAQQLRNCKCYLVATPCNCKLYLTRNFSPLYTALRECSGFIQPCILCMRFKHGPEGHVLHGRWSNRVTQCLCKRPKPAFWNGVAFWNCFLSAKGFLSISSTSPPTYFWPLGSHESANVTHQHVYDKCPRRVKVLLLLLQQPCCCPMRMLYITLDTLVLHATPPDDGLTVVPWRWGLQCLWTVYFHPACHRT